MPSYKYEAGTNTTMLDDELDALGIATGSAVGAEYDNSLTANLHPLAMFECLFDYSGAAPTVNKPIDVYYAAAPDGTNYSDGATTIRPATQLLFSLAVRAVTTDQRVVVMGVPIPPTKFKIFLVNNGDQAFGASGHTVKMLPYRTQS